MSDVFVSYASSDKEIAEALAKSLTKIGWSVFWDRTIPIGATWDQVIESELASASCVVVLWSRASVDSDWVRAEAEDAVKRGALVPVLLEDAVRMPVRFRSIQAAKAFDTLLDIEASVSFKSIVSAIERLAGPAKPSFAARVSGIWFQFYKGRDEVGFLFIEPLPASNSVQMKGRTFSSDGLVLAIWEAKSAFLDETTGRFSYSWHSHGYQQASDSTRGGFGEVEFLDSAGITITRGTGVESSGPSQMSFVMRRSTEKETTIMVSGDMGRIRSLLRHTLRKLKASQK